MLIMTINVTATVVPHSYITDNPNKRVTQTETLKKYKEKAELNLSVTKLSSKEVSGVHNPAQQKIYFSLDNMEHKIQPEDHIYISEELEEVPSISTTNGRKKINGLLNKEILKEGALEYTINIKDITTEIEISYTTVPKEIFIGILDSKYQIKKILKSSSDKFINNLANTPYIRKYDQTYNFEFNDEYAEGIIGISDGGEAIPQGIKALSEIGILPELRRKGTSDDVKLFQLQINETSWDDSRYPNGEVKLDNGTIFCMLEDMYHFKFKFKDLKKENFSFKAIVGRRIYHWTGSQSDGSGGTRYEQYNLTFNFTYKPSKIVGETNLLVDEYYDKSQYITISSSTLDNPQDASLVSPIEGIELAQAVGKGFVKFEPGDILDVAGLQSIIEGTGNISERSTNLNGVSIVYKAQNGNFQIRINDYQIGQKSPQFLPIKLIRNNKEIMNHEMWIWVPELVINNSKMNVKIRDEYKEEYFNIYNLPNNVKGIEFLSGENTISITTPGNFRLRRDEYGGFWINGIKVVDKGEESIPEKTLTFEKYTIKTQRNGDLILSLSNYPRKISEPIELILKSYIRRWVESASSGTNSNGTSPTGYWKGVRIEQQIVFYYVPSKVVGQSTLELKECYPTPEYAAFNSCTTPEPKPIELENSLRDVKVIQNSGNGLVHLEAGDILELNGKQYTIEASGNLPEQNDTIGNINFKFKVEAGKIRIALKDWGVLEPDRILTINASREGHPIMEHQMVIKAPRRVEGISNLKFNTAYTIRNIVKLQGISLTAPAVLNLETPIPAGVSLKQIDGYGVPFLKEGDILEVGNNITRAVKQYTIAKGDFLKKTLVDLPGTNVSLYVENGKVRVGLNNWLVNKNTTLQLRTIRGVNEICNMQLGLEVPEAPFDVVKNGMLDFGKVIQGSKNRRAETNILLEMHRDISEIKFNLSTRTPEMENENGTKLVAKDLETGVYKQGNRRYLVKILGRLDIPEKQEMGLYRGSAILNVEIR